MTPRRRAAIAAASASLAALALAGCSSADEAAESASTEPEASSTTDTATESAAATSSTDASGSDYVDGTYTADGSYTSPGGEETIEVTLTIADDVITAVEIDNSGTTNPNSKQYQAEFIDGIDAEVVGVALDDVDVDRVGGSSLTSGGFNEALETIKAEAAA